MNKIEKILKETIKEIKPLKEEEERILARVNSILTKINKNNKGIKAELGGSGAKGTWLKDANDADIFARFNYKKYKNKGIEIVAGIESRGFIIGGILAEKLNASFVPIRKAKKRVT